MKLSDRIKRFLRGNRSGSERIEDWAEFITQVADLEAENTILSAKRDALEERLVYVVGLTMPEACLARENTLHTRQLKLAEIEDWAAMQGPEHPVYVMLFGSEGAE